ncbi:hypothetical protein Sliba_75530 [Streptomyces nigrescens]|uniref:Insertion element IS402-like domain-containing protein n=1 Tax=Streptomyces nigrescens TaxID=1920 RepID=A0A640TVC0_STRNI|nr:hypothetical protein Sliba_75530 [Streptomyces libani subsp. libani]GGV97060.1 hypothetical protein GCM10010500_41530 [Streptomyces libani subsp. libani]
MPLLFGVRWNRQASRSRSGGAPRTGTGRRPRQLTRRTGQILLLRTTYSGRRRRPTDTEREFIGPYLPIGEYGPYPERLRQQFGGVIWRFKTGGQWREMPREFGAWLAVHHGFR